MSGGGLPGAAPTAAELGTTAAGAGISPMSALAGHIPQAFRGIQGMQSHMAPNLGVPHQQPFMGQVQMPGLMGAPQITVPQMTQALGRLNGLL